MWNMAFPALSDHSCNLLIAQVLVTGSARPSPSSETCGGAGNLEPRQRAWRTWHAASAGSAGAPDPAQSRTAVDDAYKTPSRSAWRRRCEGVSGTPREPPALGGVPQRGLCCRSASMPCPWLLARAPAPPCLPKMSARSEHRTPSCCAMAVSFVCASLTAAEKARTRGANYGCRGAVSETGESLMAQN